MVDDPRSIEPGDHGPELTGATPQLLTELLEEYERLLALQRPANSSRLAPGLTREDVEHQLRQIGLNAPEELVALYGWHNGIASHDGGGPLPFFAFHSLEDAVRTYESLSAQIAEEPDPEDAKYLTWGAERGWLMITIGNGGFAVDCNGSPTEPPLIRKTSPEYFDSDGRFTCRSLCTMAAWWVAGLKAGAYEWTGDRWTSDPTKLPSSQRAAGMT